MGKEAKRKALEIGIGVLLYTAAWVVKFNLTISNQKELFLFLLAYTVLSATTYWEQLRKINKIQFFDENLLMIAATAGAFFIGKHNEAVAAMLFFQIGKFVETMSINKTQKSISDYIDLRPEYANLKIGDTEKTVLPRELELDQEIILRPGERIPIDAIVTAGTGHVDMKALTGESEPSAVKPGDRIYSGAININGVLTAKVIRLYHESTASKIMNLVENADDKKSKSIRFADRFTRYYTPLVLCIAVLTMILPPMMFSFDKTEWIYRGLIIMVAACPCGLMISIPLAFFGGIGAAARQGVLIKGAAFLEDLTLADTFVFDKTGTLTEGVFHVRQLVSCGMDESCLLETAVLAEAYSKHPIAMSVREAYGKKLDLSRAQGIEEQPGYGVKAKVDGKTVHVGNPAFMEKLGIEYTEAKEAGTAVYVAVDGTCVGYIVISDLIRDDSYRLIKWLKKKNLAVVMFTGDNEEAAEAVSGVLGIDSVYAELMPEEKVEILEEFRENQVEGEKLVFIGDGINDAPVLAQADLGIAMGGLGADAALEAADIILMNDEPSKIINAVKISKATLRSVRQNMAISIGMKIILIVLAFAGLITMQNAIVADMAVMLINILNSFWMTKYPEQGV